MAFSKDMCVRDTTDFLIANGIFHRSDVTLDEGNPDYGPELPHLYASIKTHKQIHPGRFIAASRAVTTTGLSRWLSSAFRALLPSMENLWWEEMLRAGIATDPEEGCQSWMVWDGYRWWKKCIVSTNGQRKTQAEGWRCTTSKPCTLRFRYRI